MDASKGGTKVGRIKDSLYKNSHLGITPPTFILPFEALIDRMGELNRLEASPPDVPAEGHVFRT